MYELLVAIVLLIIVVVAVLCCRVHQPQIESAPLAYTTSPSLLGAFPAQVYIKSGDLYLTNTVVQNGPVGSAPNPQFGLQLSSIQPSFRWLLVSRAEGDYLYYPPSAGNAVNVIQGTMAGLILALFSSTTLPIGANAPQVGSTGYISWKQASGTYYMTTNNPSFQGAVTTTNNPQAATTFTIQTA
jgi:hypothetical protein